MKRITRFKRDLVEGKVLYRAEVNYKKFKKNLFKPYIKQKRRLDRKFGELVRCSYYKTVDVVPNRIMFVTFNGVYNCNLKYITEELVKQNVPVEIYWGLTAKQIKTLKKGDVPEEVNIVTKYSFDYFKALASSKVWVDNALCCVWQYIPKKKEQVYIETWHGSMGLKRISKEDIKDKAWLKKAEICKQNVDYCISDSTFETQVFRDTYFPDNEILEYGHARNDILVNSPNDISIKEKVCKCYNISRYDDDDNLITNLDNVKICLYAPTFRDNNSIDCYDLDFERLHKALSEKFGGRWLIFNRFHFHTKTAKSNQDKLSYVIDVTQYPDIQELIISADVGITDYSSWICDYVLTGKPGFIYARDLDEYDDIRGLYYPLDETPFPIATNNDEMVQNVLDFDDNKYQKEKAEFLAARGCKEDGHASEKIVQLIKNIMNIK
jgi:CDP-glycerol glycerophosphotransferase